MTDKSDFALAVLLIMKQDGLKKPDATFKAWLEGPAGLARRTGQGRLPGMDDATQGKVTGK